MTWLLLLASLAHGQEISTSSLSAPIEQDLKISNISKAINALESGRPRITGKPTYANGFCFADATCQTTAATFTTTPAFSTSTPSGSGTNTTLDVSAPVAGSALTIAMNGGGLACGYSGSVSNTSGVGLCLGIRVNGEFWNGTAASTCLQAGHLNGLSSNGLSMGFVSIGTGTYTGTLAVALLAATNTGTWVIPGATNTGFTDKAQFKCWEIR